MTIRRQLHRFAAVLLAAAVWSCGDSGTGPVDGAFPALLSELGVDQVGAELFAPRWELWTNGSIKTRKILFTEGGTINISDRSRWEFPDGIRITKTFAYRTQASPNTPVPIETRVIRKRAGRWETAVYQWRPDLSDADLLDGSAPVDVPVTTPAGQSFSHEIPSSAQCQVCHGLNTTFLIGVTELQLNSTLPGEGQTQLAKFGAAGLFNQAPPATPVAVTGPDSLTREVIGYVQGNCRHCHNPRSTVNFSHETFLANTLNQTGPTGTVLVRPGQPDSSLIYIRFSSGAMPALGVRLGDTAARDRMRQWILSLP